MTQTYDVISLFKEVLGDDISAFTLPPESFSIMQSKIIDFNKKTKSISVTMPVLNFTLNPYKTMQGGFITVALDNAIGPLSLLIAPFNMSRRISTDYRKPITQDISLLIITATLSSQKGRKLFFDAKISDEEGTVYATAYAENWIIRK